MLLKPVFIVGGYILKKALIISIFTVLCLSLTLVTSWAQCPPTINLSSASESIIIDDFGDISAGVTRNGATNISVDAGCIWDLFAAATLTLNVPYSGQGVALPLSAVEIRAVNVCGTPDHTYVPDPARITGTFGTGPDAGTPNYIVGTALVEGGAVVKIPVGPCAAGTTVNAIGTAAANPTTHTFRIDIRITPGVVPVITPGLYDLAIDFTAMQDAAPNTFDLKSFNLQIEILPILQMKMSTSDQVDFIFSEIADYAGGITRYGATVLSVSSSLDWDLMAVGTSSLNESTAGASPFWDQNLSYAAIGSASIPLGVLELHQIPNNPTGSGAGVDYSSAFTIPPSGNNYIEVGSQLGAAIVFTSAPPGAKTIAGDWGAVAGGGVSSVLPGSYLTPLIGGGAVGDYRYAMTYKITPGLPATFNGLMGEAQPGYYTMQIRYLLVEDQ